MRRLPFKTSFVKSKKGILRGYKHEHGGPHLAKRIPQLKKPAKCADCNAALRAAEDHLFDPNTARQLQRMTDKTFGRFRHHFHRMTLAAEYVGIHYFEVYQASERGLPEVIVTDWSRYLDVAVENAFELRAYLTEQELKTHGL